MIQNLRKVSAYLFGLRLLRTAMSVVTVALSAKYFGIGIERDIWLLVVAFITTINLAVWGPINETFRTRFIFLREQEGESEALHKTASLLSFIILGTALISGLIMLFPEFLMHIIAPSVSESDSPLFIRMLYLLVPTFLINQLVVIGMSILNAYESFYIPEIVNFFSGILHILCLLLLAPVIGINSLVVSIYLSLTLLLLVLVFCIYKKKIKIGRLPLFFSWKAVKPFVIFSIPFFIPYFVSQCNAIIEKSISNLMGIGIVSTIDYARRFTEVLLGVFLGVLSSVLVPVLSKHYSDHDDLGFLGVFKQYVQVVFLFLALTLPLLVGAALPIDTFFYFRGEITMDTVQEMALLTRFYGISFISVALYLFFGLSLLAQNQGKKYAIYGALAQVIMIVFDVLFYKMLGIYTFVIALFISHTAMAVAMYYCLKLVDKKEVTTYIFRYLFLLLVLITIQIVFNYYLVGMHVILQILFQGICLLITLPLFAWMFGFNLKHYIMIIKTKLG